MTKNDIIYSKKIVGDISITYDSDLHYMPGMKLDYLYRQLSSLEKNPTTYYFFLGDLINDSKIDVKDLKEIRDIFSKIAKTRTRVYIVLGNRDQTTDVEGRWQEYYNQEYADMLRDIDEVTVLENESVQDENIVIHGTMFSPEYYYDRNHEPEQHYIEVMKNTLTYKDDTFNILLDHSPYRVFDENVFTRIPNLSSTDLVFSGHFHNGLIPSYLDKVLPGNFGITAYRKIFPENARGRKKINNGTIGLISSPITTFSGHHGVMRRLNMFYPPIEQKVLVKKIY